MLSKPQKILLVMTFLGDKNYITRDVITIIFIIIISVDNVCSMVAEIGGYSGLLIGFSLMDLAMLLKNVVNLLNHNH